MCREKEKRKKKKKKEKRFPPPFTKYFVHQLDILIEIPNS
jgi:hypothetical protein